MKKILFSFAIGLLSLALQAQVQYTSPTGNFKATFPAIVETDASDLELSNGSSVLYTFMAFDEAFNVYMISYAEYPNNSFSDKSKKEEFLESSVKGFFGELNIIAQNRKKVKCKKYKGLEYRGQSSEYSTIYRVFIAGNTVFQLVALGTGSYPPEEQTKKLFKSFKITL